MRWRIRELWRRGTAIFIARQRFWLTLGGVAFLALLLLGHGSLLTLVSQTKILWTGAQGEAARAWVRSFGPLAPLAYIVLFAFQILLAPVPGHFMGLMGGYLFGAVWGSLYSLAGLGLGAGLAASVARYLGRPLIEKLVGEQQLRYWERRLRVRSAFTWWLIFLFPVPDAVYYVAGLSGVPFRWLLLAILAGRGPGLVMGNWVGDRAIRMPPGLVLMASIVLVVVIFVVYRHQRRLRLISLLILRRVRRVCRWLR
ncbi:MAG TPA: TVP38/TMEM64 family protein [Caldilineae bacterium]|nr:TVP38/TMEM64 family protein [Caldilineae bacterium]